MRSDFSFALVADNSSTDTPIFYRLTALVVSQAGSLLLWVFLLSLCSSAVLFVTRRQAARDRALRDRRAAAASRRSSSCCWSSSPPVRDAGATRRPRATGLNPLLRHPSDDDPPADALLGLRRLRGPVRVRGRRAGHARGSDASWIRSTRRFALVAWTFLGSGILLGALWSYSELGWGGYWAWDPVENASLMPWLIGTAFLHSVMVQEKRGMLKVWNVSLVAGAVRARAARHVPRALRDPRLDPRLRRLDARRAVPRFIARDRRSARSRWSSAARPACAPSTGSTRCSRARRSSCSTTSCSSACASWSSGARSSR